METQSCFRDARLYLHLKMHLCSCKVRVLFSAEAQVLIPCSLSSAQRSQGMCWFWNPVLDHSWSEEKGVPAVGITRGVEISLLLV